MSAANIGVGASAGGESRKGELRETRAEASLIA